MWSSTYDDGERINDGTKAHSKQQIDNTVLGMGSQHQMGFIIHAFICLHVGFRTQEYVKSGIVG